MVEIGCGSCIHYAMCIWRREVDELTELVCVPYRLTRGFRIWREGIADMCDYFTPGRV